MSARLGDEALVLEREAGRAHDLGHSIGVQVEVATVLDDGDGLAIPHQGR